MTNIAITAFTAWLRLDKGLSEKTVGSYASDLEQFISFLREKKVKPEEVEERDLIVFLEKLRKKGRSDSSLKRKISSLRSFYTFQESQGLLENPTSFLENPKKGRKLPNYISEKEINALFESIGQKAPIEKQYYLMLLLLYSCGLRISELLDLKLSQINRKKRIFRIEGKGNKERLVPYPEEIEKILDNYVKDIWPKLNLGFQENVLFVQKSKSGVRPISRQQFFYKLKLFGEKAGIEKKLSPHMLRHSFASQLLKNGMNLRVLQKLLGHSSISSTQIYTHVEEERLQKGHRKFHPRK